jgi:hypothetical protein
MQFDWQNVLIAAVLLAAAGYVLVRGWRAVRGKKTAGCGGCGTCPSTPSKSNPARADALLQIDPPPRS